MKYENVAIELLKEFPDFCPDPDSMELQYAISGYFAGFLLEHYKQGDMATVKRGLLFIEAIHNSKESMTRELATIGYLEDIQNLWANRGVDPELIFDLLGDESKKGWVALNKFWNKQE